jgi:hypothetical protein
MIWSMSRNSVAIALGMLALATEFAAADPARVTANVNLRQGPGTTFGIVTTIPRGTVVNVLRCTGEWCNIRWRDRGGYALARNLGPGGPGAGPPPGAPVVAGPPPGGPVVVAPPPGAPVVVGPPPVYYYGGPYYRRGPYWGPRWRVGWRAGWRGGWRRW